jgi:hypothetical protein
LHQVSVLANGHCSSTLVPSLSALGKVAAPRARSKHFHANYSSSLNSITNLHDLPSCTCFSHRLWLFAQSPKFPIVHLHFPAGISHVTSSAHHIISVFDRR